MQVVYSVRFHLTVDAMRALGNHSNEIEVYYERALAEATPYVATSIVLPTPAEIDDRDGLFIGGITTVFSTGDILEVVVDVESHWLSVADIELLWGFYSKESGTKKRAEEALRF